MTGSTGPLTGTSRRRLPLRGQCRPCHERRGAPASRFIPWPTPAGHPNGADATAQGPESHCARSVAAELAAIHVTDYVAPAANT